MRNVLASGHGRSDKLERAVEAEKFEYDQRLRHDSHELHLPAVGSHSLVERYQHPDTGAVDKTQLGKIHDNGVALFGGQPRDDWAEVPGRERHQLAPHTA